MEAKEALKLLKEGNERFVKDEMIHPRCDKAYRETLLNGQKPFAIVISCSDSRVPVEIIFDAGIGDIFVIRTAGHGLSREVIGSVKYAVEHLGVELVVILSHENCGAVTSALEAYIHKKFDHLGENLKALLGHIHIALEKKYTTDNPPEVADATYTFMHHLLDEFKHKSSRLADKLSKGEITLIGGYYSLRSGEVKFYE